MKKFNKIKSKWASHRTLRSYIWVYMMVFTVFILVLIWVFQYLLLDNYYQAAKIRDITNAASKIIDAYATPSMNRTNRRLAFENNFCMVITDESLNLTLSENNLGAYSTLVNDITENYSKQMREIKSKLDKSNQGFYTQTIKSEFFDSREIIYCAKIYDDKAPQQAYLFIESSIEPIDSTVNIIREQLIYITLILFELAFITTMFISKKLSQPISSIIATARKFGEGDYNVEFKGEGYLEIEELSNVLNHAKNEIRKVSDLRKDLIANISHDLRTPLTMVKAYAEMIRDLSGDNPVKRQEHIQIIIDEADRLSTLVNNILELSKLESGNMELEITEFSVSEKIQDCMTRYTLLNEQQGYDIKYIPDEDRIIAADVNKLDQVIYNFINNAVNYCGEDKFIRIKQINKPDVVRIEVIDHGKGISKELLPLIFDRYYRDAKYKREVIGTGLGLSICKEILKKHDFAFGVLSEEGKGSTFWFEAKISKSRKKIRQV